MPIKINLYGLAYSCPHLERRPDCPLKQVEHLSFLEKVKWIDQLSDEKRKVIFEHHKVCTKKIR
jgi:hypothetical protein